VLPEIGSPARARLRVAGRVFLVVLLVWVLATVGIGFVARQRVNSGLNTLESARNQLDAQSLLRGDGTAVLQRAERDFSRAHSLASSFVLAPWTVVPLASTNVNAARSLTGAAQRVAAIGARTSAAASTALRVHPATPAERLALLDRVAAIAAGAERELDGVSLGSDFFLVGPLGSARTRFLDRLHKLRDAITNADALVSGVARVLRGPQRYLILAANNAEMRAGSGMFLSVGTATFADGGFTVSTFQPTPNVVLPPGGVPVTGDLAALWGWTHPGQEWRNLATTPRFDVTAPLAAQMWQAATGQSVDGVLAVDPQVLEAVLDAQGPIAANGGSLRGQDVVSYLLLGQYAGIPANVGDQADRNDQLSAVARAAVDTLSTRPWVASSLVGNLAGVGKGRHALAWSRDPVLERAWQAAGIGGELPSDALAVSILNFGGNKLDQFLDVQASLTLRPAAGGGQHAHLALRIRNTAPVDVPGYVAGPYPGSGLGEGVYQGVLAVSVPGGASLPRVGIAAPTLAAGADGPTTVVAHGYFPVARGQVLDVPVDFDLPAGLSALQVIPSARIPPITWHFGQKTFQDTAPERLQW